MSVAAYAQTPYGQHARALKTPRDIEYDLIATITGRLRSAAQQSPGRIDATVATALHDNARLWSTLAADLAHPENAFPEGLRAQMLGLARFVLQQTLAIHAGTAGIDVLVDINTAIMRGLRQASERS